MKERSGQRLSGREKGTFDLLRALQEQYVAFKKSRVQLGITQKMIAEVSGVTRHGDISDVFRYLEGKTDVIPVPSKLYKVFRTIDEYWTIDNEGFLVRKGGDINRLDEKSTVGTVGKGITVHKNFSNLNINEAIKFGGDTICILNTYLSTSIFNMELTIDNEGSIQNWLHQGKKIKLLLLDPSGHGFSLRTKADLGLDGTTLVEMVIMRLRSLMKIQMNLPGQLQVRIMDELPAVSAIILEKRLFFGLYYSFGHSENGSYFEVTDPENHTYKDIVNHFDRIWNDDNRSTPLSQELLGRITNAMSLLRNTYFLGGTHWSLFIHDLNDIINNRLQTTPDSITGISTWDLKIAKPSKLINLQASLTIPGRAPIEGSIVTERIRDREYAYVRFTDFESLSVYLTMYCEYDKEDYITGYAQINSGMDSCSSFIVLKRHRLVQKHDFNADELALYYKGLLTYRDKSFQSLEQIRKQKLKFDINIWAGTYKVYSYGKIGRSSGIKVNWLRIDECGVAFYKNHHYKELKGRVTHIEPNLHINFSHYRNEEEQKRKYLIITVGKNEPQIGRYYSGVGLGVTWAQETPISKRFILEYKPEDSDTTFEDLKVEEIVLHSQAYKDMKPEIRKLLSGRVKNMIGFLRGGGRIFEYGNIINEWKNSIDLSEVFYDSAVLHAKRGNYRKSAEMLIRAVNHGFDDVARFEQEVEKYHPNTLEQIKKEHSYNNVLKIGSSLEDSFDPGG